MKIIRITDRLPRQMSDVDFHPDSALLLPGRPMFYPDFAGDWQAQLYMAVHINRLGKSVSAKFAPRYYDGASVAVRVEPVAADSIPSGRLSGLDSSITHGEWIPAGELSAMKRLVIDGNEVVVDMPDAETVNRAVAWISEMTMLRMGDIIMLPLGMAPVALAPHTYLTIDICGTDRRLMEVKVV